MLTPDDYPRLSVQTLRGITKYKHAAKQLEVLHAAGFWRARIDRYGQVVLEAAHYEAVCAGAASPGSAAAARKTEPLLASEMA